MRSRLLVLNMFSFVLSLAFLAGCGPGFKSGNDKQEKKAPATSAPQSPAAESAAPAASGEATDDNSEPPLDQDGTTAGTRLIGLNTQSREIADKLIKGVQLDKGVKKNTLMIVMKDSASDEKPNVELQAVLSTEVSDVQNNSVANEDLTFSPIGQTPIEIKRDQYSVSYVCLNACATIVVDVQRIIGEITNAEGQKVLQGYRVSFKFEASGADGALLLVDSSLTDKEKIISATEARLQANPAAPVEPAPQITARPQVTPPVPAPAPAPVKTPAQLAAEARNALAARINALPNPTIHRQMPNCDRNSPAFKAAIAKMKQDIVDARIKAAIAAGIVLTEANKKDPTLFRANEPWFPAGSRCNAPAAAAAPKAPAAAPKATPAPTPSPTPTAAASSARVVEAAPAAVMTRPK